MLRYWLDDVGDGLLYGTFVITFATAALSFLVHAPEGFGRAAVQEFEEVREITVGMLPAPVLVMGDLAELAVAESEEVAAPTEVPSEAPPGRAPVPELVGASDDEPPPPAPGAATREAAVEAARAATVAAKTKAARKKPCDDTPDPGIVKLSSESWTIDREVVKRYTRDWKRLNDLGWSARHEGPDGKSDGMLIGGVRCGSDLHDAGIRAGDIVHTVNGRDVHNIPQAILVYTAVRNDPVVEVAVTTRKGVKKTLTYRFTG